MKKLTAIILTSTILLSPLLFTSFCHANVNHPNEWKLKSFRKKLVESSITTPDVSGMVEVPFTLLKAKDVTGTVAFNVRSGRSKLRLDTGNQILFSIPGIPVALQNTGDNLFTIVFRTIPSNRLQLIEWNLKTGHTHSIPIARKGVDNLLFRSVTTVGKSLYIVVYDNRDAKNYLRHYQRINDSWSQTSPEIALPTLEDPAGTHYEMEPPLKLFAEKNGVHIVGGTLDAFVNNHQLTERRIPNCKNVIEAIKTPQGIIALCNRKLVDAQGAFAVHNLHSGKKYQYSY